MSDLPKNRVRERRDALGLSQVALAAAVQLSRQSLSSIEAGRAVPGVDVALRLAHALGWRVEELFPLAPVVATLSAEIAGESSKLANLGRVALAQVAGRWVCYPLTGDRLRTAADGVVLRAGRGHAEIECVQSVSEAQANIVLMGCAAALGLLSDRLNRHSGAGRFVWLSCSSTRALDAFGKRQTHVAGVHLVDAKTGEANVADVRRYVAAQPVSLITLARWEAGLVVAAGNPRKIRGAADLGRRDLRCVVREAGSGARRLFDRILKESVKGERSLRQPSVLASGHLEVAHAVALAAADVGVATRDVAIAFGLDFVPLIEERYDLALAPAQLEDERIQRWLHSMTTLVVRRELESLGYDTRCTGERVAELCAA
jgi:putative molybdopterin biosynthesis protein